MNLFLKRVALKATLFLLAATYTLLTFGAPSSVPTPPRESTKNIINQVQTLLLSQNREQAIQLVISQLKIEKPHSKNYKELINTLKKTSELFFSEKAQQNYELAIAVYQTDKNQTKEKLLESLKLEPKNILILKGLVFTYLSLKDCNSAKSYLSELKPMGEYDEDIEKLQILNLVCFKNKAEALSVIAKMDPENLNSPFWIVNKYRLQLIINDFINTTLKYPQDYPELIYVLWMQEKALKAKSILADKYKQLCQTPVTYDKAYSYADPWVCEHIKEISD